MLNFFSINLNQSFVKNSLKFFFLAWAFFESLAFFNMFSMSDAILWQSSLLLVSFFFLLFLPLIYILILISLPYLNRYGYKLNYFVWLKLSLKFFLFIYLTFYLILVYQLFNMNAALFAQFKVSEPFTFFESTGSLQTVSSLLSLLFNPELNFNTLVPAAVSFIFYIDVLGILFMGLSLLLIFLCVLFLWPTIELEKNIILYLSQLFLLLTQLQMTFTAANLLTFFVAFESLLIPMILMIAVWGSPNRRQANNYLVFYTMVSAVPMLLGIIYIQQKYGNLDISYLMTVATWTWSEQFWLWSAFFFAFAVKTPMVPVHIWLPKAHVDAPTVGSVILAGLLLKVGLVGFIRILLPLFPEATHFFAPYVSSLATVGVIYASFITLRQIDMKRIIAYSSVAHMNMAVVSLCSLNPLGLYSSIYLMLSHGFIASGLFFLVGFLYNRFHVRAVAYFGGLATIMPVMTVVFFLFSLANMAFPFTSGFIGEFLLLLSISSTNLFLGFLNATSMLLTTIYTMLLFGRVFLGELKPKFQALAQGVNYNLPTKTSFLVKKFSIYDLYYYEFVIVAILLFFIFWLGCYPQVLFSILLKSSNLGLICAFF